MKMINELTHHWGRHCYLRQLKCNIGYSLLGCYHNYGWQKVLTTFQIDKVIWVSD